MSEQIEKIIIPFNIYKSLLKAKQYHEKYKRNAELVKSYLIENNLPIDIPINNFVPDKSKKTDNIIKYSQLTIKDFN